MSSSPASPVSFSGLASGLNTSGIIQALLEAERRPEVQFANEQTRIEGQRTQLVAIQSALQQLSFAAQETGLAVLSRSQVVTSSNTSIVAATTTGTAPIGGHELEISQLATASQRTFTFTSPSSADKLTIDGHEYEVAAGGSIASLISAINADSAGTVYAASAGTETVVLSTRTTGAGGEEFIKLEDPGGTLVEQAGLAKEGHNAEYKIDGTAASSSTNTLTAALPGVTLSLKALTGAGSPVTVAVEPPAPETSKIVAQVQSFVSLYNSTISTIEHQVQTKPPASPASTAELQSGTLFGDTELMTVLNRMRSTIYEAQPELPAGTSALAQIGVTTGAASGKAVVAQSAIEGQLQLETAKLEQALQSEPANVQKLLQKWSSSFQSVLSGEALAGGTLEARATSDAEQASAISKRIEKMNEAIALRQQTLQAQFAAMESVIAQSHTESAWFASQISSLGTASSPTSSSSSSTASALGL